MGTLKQHFIQGLSSLFLLGLVTACNGSKKEIATESPVNVKTLVVTSTSGDAHREYIGTVESENTVDLSFQISGNIAQTYVEEGQSVEKGELLARLSTTTYSNLYASAKATLNQAKDAYNRLSILDQSNSLPEIKFIEAQTALEQAQANERIAKKNLNDCNLYAPHAGVIGKRLVEAGANVMQGNPVLNLMEISSVKIKIPVPENDIPFVKLQQECKIKITALGNEEFSGKITEKGVIANPVSHTYDIKVKVENGKRKIMPGMVCKAYLPNMEKSGGLVVPIQAVQVASTGKNFIWLVDKSGKAFWKEVTTGDLTGNGIIIESGLSEGEVVVVEGYQNLSQGIQVKAI